MEKKLIIDIFLIDTFGGIELIFIIVYGNVAACIFSSNGSCCHILELPLLWWSIIAL